MSPVICQAINEKRLLRIEFNPGERIIEPHTHGTNSEGNNLLRAYQVFGASASGRHVDWKLFRVDRIRSIELLDDEFFEPRHGYKKDDPVMARIFCEL